MSSTAAQSRPQMTVDEYLAFEESSSIRHEFYRGEMFAMAGGSSAHSQLQWRLAAILDPQLRGTGYQGFNNDMRVKVEATGLYTYPDASVGCGSPQFDTDKRNTLLNPVAVFEVLSKSTEAYDRGGKFEHYRKLPSLRHYVLISQADRRIEVFTRSDEGHWRLGYAEQGGEVVDLEFIHCRLPLDDLYEGIELQPDERNKAPVDPEP